MLQKCPEKQTCHFFVEVSLRASHFSWQVWRLVKKISNLNQAKNLFVKNGWILLKNFHYSNLTLFLLKMGWWKFFGRIQPFCKNRLLAWFDFGFFFTNLQTCQEKWEARKETFIKKGKVWHLDNFCSKTGTKRQNKHIFEKKLILL